MESSLIVDLINSLSYANQNIQEIKQKLKNLMELLKDKIEGKKWKYSFFLIKGGIPIISSLLTWKQEEELEEENKEFLVFISTIIMYLERNDDCRNLLSKFGVHRELVKLIIKSKNKNLIKVKKKKKIL